MISIQEKLYIDAESFFDAIAHSVAYDISDASGKKTSIKQIKKGFSYTKVMKNKVKRKGKVSVKITKWNPPFSYSAEFTSFSGINTLSYEIETLEEGCIGVNYMEDFKGVTKSKDMNFKLVSVFYNRKAKKRALRLIRAIEKYAQETKGNIKPEGGKECLD